MKEKIVAFWEKVLDNLGLDTWVGAGVLATVVCVCLFIIFL